MSWSLKSDFALAKRLWILMQGEVWARPEGVFCGGWLEKALGARPGSGLFSGGTGDPLIVLEQDSEWTGAT